MPNLTLRDVPPDLHGWLKQQAAASRRSLNQEVILRLDAMRRPAERAGGSDARLESIRAIAARTASMQVLDRRSEDDILGLGADGMPR